MRSAKLIAAMSFLTIAGVDGGCAYRAPGSVLRVGAGPEDLVVASWPYARANESDQVAITSLADRRRPKGPSNVGFVFIRIQNGRPEVFGEKGQVPAGTEEHAPPWQGLYWQPHAAFAGGRGVLAATRTARWDTAKGWLDAGGIVDFFVWSDSPMDQPRLVHHSRTDELRGPGGPDFNLNSVVLTRNGTVYASVMSLFGSAEVTTICEPTHHDPCQRVERGAVYRWRRDEGWWLVAWVKGANGLALSRDEQTLYVNSAGTGSSLAFTVDGSRLLSKPEATVSFGACAAPDNLKLLEDGRLVALSTPRRVSTGVYLLLQRYFGRSFVSPTGDVWTWNPANQGETPKHEFSWPNGYVGPSATIKLGDWWLGGQMFDDTVAVKYVRDSMP